MAIPFSLTVAHKQIPSRFQSTSVVLSECGEGLTKPHPSVLGPGAQMLQLTLRVHRWLKFASGDIPLQISKRQGSKKAPHICGCRLSGGDGAMDHSCASKQYKMRVAIHAQTVKRPRGVQTTILYIGMQGVWANGVRCNSCNSLIPHARMLLNSGVARSSGAIQTDGFICLENRSTRLMVCGLTCPNSWVSSVWVRPMGVRHCVQFVWCLCVPRWC